MINACFTLLVEALDALMHRCTVQHTGREQEARFRTLALHSRLQRSQRRLAEAIIAVKLKAPLAKAPVAIALQPCQ
jgi:hypothetical protein